MLAALAWPALVWQGVVCAQPAGRAGKTMRVGILSPGTRAIAEVGNSKTFIDAMRELGWVEGRNVVYDRVYADYDLSRLPALAAELADRAPDLIWVLNMTRALVAFASTRTIPFVFHADNYVVERGIVKSLARPGGNVTGVQSIGWQLDGKRMQLLREALPKMRRVGVLVTATRPTSLEQKLIEKAAGDEVKVIFAMVKEPQQLDAVIASLVKNGVEALFLPHNSLFHNNRKQILALAASRRLPVVGARSEFTDDGALMSYGATLSEQIRISAQMVDKILKGTKPADIPVEQPTRFELVVSLKTAKALGITIPEKLLLRTDRVIE